ncbi:monovalent cation/H+ antiporter complex subunit F [Oceanibaculum pacificum]|uniref:Cation:proton antiporter n=1 Tax=Oceanibaculum pacificum TaxID=580166 RepID=A0A154W6D5_9PROT|nr:monovalent cation/H+ antiporter complex subunit F [Oceanibaculum pacificum]KZD09011.1 hypothetical protein AUP43_07875 [Oceanibaculum pacificum]
MNLILIASAISGALVGVSLLAVTWRLLAGPSAADRVVAIDLLSLLGVCIASLTAVMTGVVAYLYIAFGLAIFGFLAAVAFATLLERASVDPEKEPV